MKALRIRFMCEVGNGCAHGYVYRGDAGEIESKKYSWKTRVATGTLVLPDSKVMRPGCPMAHLSHDILHPCSDL